MFKSLGKFFRWLFRVKQKNIPVKKLSFLVDAPKPKVSVAAKALSGYQARFQIVNKPGTRPVSFGNFRKMQPI